MLQRLCSFNDTPLLYIAHFQAEHGSLANTCEPGAEVLPAPLCLPDCQQLRTLVV